jgi:hypothetical protein
MDSAGRKLVSTLQVIVCLTLDIVEALYLMTVLLLAHYRIQINPMRRHSSATHAEIMG